MGDRRKPGLRVQLDGKLRLEFDGAKITSDAGLLAFRELDEAFRLTERGGMALSDSRRGKNKQHSMLATLKRDNRCDPRRRRPFCIESSNPNQIASPLEVWYLRNVGY